MLPFFVVVGVLDVLAALEPDLGRDALHALAGGAALRRRRAHRHFVTLCALAIPVLWHKIEKLQYALLRLTSFLDPGGAPAEVNYQLKQSLSPSARAACSASASAREAAVRIPAVSVQRFHREQHRRGVGLPRPRRHHLAFAAYALLGFRIARHARTPFLQLVAVGLTFVTVITAYLHIGVVIGLLPTTGLTLPFVSYGRSNIVLTMFLTGVLVNIGSAKERVIGSGATDPMASPRVR